MGQDKNLKPDLLYLNRFMDDLQKIRLGVESNRQSRSYDEACVDIFSSVKKYCEDQISAVIDDGQKGLAQNLENFSNQILRRIQAIQQTSIAHTVKINNQLELLNQTIESARFSSEELGKQIVDLENQEMTDEPLPPVRKRPNIRKTGERPPKISERTEDS
tara:strand:+ start:523 stop:1005 length:483 start_codon:yes stop_codon:yes gene_type:complete